MPTGFNPFAIPNIPNVPAVPMPRVDPNAGLQALLAVQNAIARQQAMAARAAGTGGRSGDGSDGKTNIIELPDGTGKTNQFSITGPAEGERKRKEAEIRRKNLYTIAQNDKALQESLAKLKNMSVAGQKIELDKIRRQHIPRIADLGGDPDGAEVLLRDLTTGLKEDIDRQQKAINNTSILQSAWDSLRIGAASLVDSIKSIGKSSAEQIALGRERDRRAQEILQTNPHLREKRLQQQEGIESSFMDNPVLNTVESLGESLADIGALAGGQAAGAATAGTLISMIPHPVTRVGGKLIGAALGGGAVGSTLGPTQLVDRIIAANPNASDAELAQMLDKGQTAAKVASGVTGGIPLMFTHTGLPFVSRTASTMLGRRYLQKEAAARAAKALEGTVADGVSKEAIQKVAEAQGRNAVLDAMQKQAERGFLSRYATSLPMTAVDLGTLGAIGATGQNIAYNEATGENIPWTQGAGDAFVSSMTMAPFFGLLNARRPKPPTERVQYEALPLRQVQNAGAKPAAASIQLPPEAAKLQDFLTNAKQFGPKERAEFLELLKTGEILPENVQNFVDAYNSAKTKSKQDTQAINALQRWKTSFDNLQNANTVLQKTLTEAGLTEAPIAVKGDKNTIQNFIINLELAAKNYTPTELEGDVFYKLMHGEIHRGDIKDAIKKSNLTSDQKRVANTAADIYNAYYKDTGTTSSGSGTTPPVARDGQKGKGNADTTNTVSDSTKPTDTAATVTDIADKLSERPAGNDKTNESGGDTRVSAQDTRKTETDEGVTSEPDKGDEQAANGKSSSERPAEQLAEPNPGERGDKLAAGAGEGRDGVAEPTGGDKPDTVKSLYDIAKAAMEVKYAGRNLSKKLYDSFLNDEVMLIKWNIDDSVDHYRKLPPEQRAQYRDELKRAFEENKTYEKDIFANIMYRIAKEFPEDTVVPAKNPELEAPVEEPYKSSILEGSPNLETDSAVELEFTLANAIKEKHSKADVLKSVKDWANRMIADGEPPSEIRDALTQFSDLPQMHKGALKAIDALLKKAEKQKGTSINKATDTVTDPLNRDC